MEAEEDNARKLVLVLDKRAANGSQEDHALDEDAGRFSNPYYKMQREICDLIFDELTQALNGNQLEMFLRYIDECEILRAMECNATVCYDESVS